MRWVSAGLRCRRGYHDDGSSPATRGRGAFAGQLTAAFPLLLVVRQKNSVPSIVCSRLWGSIEGTIGYWVRCRASAASLR